MFEWLKLGAISLLLSTLLSAIALLPIILALGITERSYRLI